MKTQLTIFALLLFAVVRVQAQYNSSVPWMKDLQQKKSLTGNDSYTFKEITDAFDAYWVGKNPNEKGSGYKPFMRWREHWKNALLEDGKVPSPEHLYNAWKKNDAMPKINTGSRAENWQPVGPTDYSEKGGWNPGMGRVNVAVVDPNNENIFYVGTPVGGIWKSKDAGNSWQCLSDDYPFMGVSAIAIDPNSYDSGYNESRTIYISTGDDDKDNTYGLGIYKSETAGADWSETALSFTKESKNTEVLGRIFIDPVNSDNVWVGTKTGIFKLSNNGQTVEQKYQGSVTDFQMHPTSHYAYFSTSGGFSGSKMFRINTATSALTEIAQNKINSDYIVIEVTSLRPDYVYFMTINSSEIKIYESNNKGNNFNLIADDNAGSVMPVSDGERNQLDYNLAFTVSDSSNYPDDFFIGAINVWKGTIGRNGNETIITKVNHWNIKDTTHLDKVQAYTHADIHYLKYFDDKVFCGSDGGFYLSNDNGASFTSLSKNGMQISQFYDVDLPKRSNSNNIIGGTQDNGGFVYDNNEWQNFYGADGTSCVVVENEYSERDYYGFTQFGGRLDALKHNENKGAYVTGNPTANDGNWSTPLVSNRKGELFAGYKKLYKLENNNFVTTHSDYDYEFNSNANWIEINPKNDDFIYVGAGTNLYRSLDKGATWSLIYTFSKSITSIEVNNDDGNKAYVTLAGWTPEILQTDNINTSTVIFNSIKGNNFPDGESIVIKHHKGTETLYVSTFYGVYVKQGNNNWVNYSQSLPDGPIKDIEIDLIDNQIIAATYSRGIWRSSLIDAKPDVVAPTKPNLEASDVSYKSVKLSWDDVLNNEDGYYEIETTTSKKIVKPILKIEGNTAIIEDLTHNTEYSFRVKASDYFGNSIYSSIVTIKTLYDTELPSVPENFKIDNQYTDESKISPDWSSSTDDVGVLKYELVVMKDGEELFTKEVKHRSGLVYFDVIDLEPDTEYGFKVRAVDVNDNKSDYTKIIKGKTFSGKCEAEVTSYPYSESFETGLGKWQQDSVDDGDWLRKNGPTPSGNTGPDSASNRDHYMYIESSSVDNGGIGTPNKVAILNSPCFEIASTMSSAKFSFDYHMYGANMGSLILEISKNNSRTWEVLWEKSGDQGDAWNTEEVVLKDIIGKNIRLRFVGQTGSDYKSDIAIDNISLTSSISNEDTIAPTTPLNLEASNVTEDTADLSWEASTDNIGVTGYDVYMNNSLYTTVNTTEANVTGLSKSSGYQFKVQAKDAAGNLSEFSNAVIVETLGDIEAPTPPTNLTASSITQTTADLSWDASVDNIAVTGYDVYKNDGFYQTVTATNLQVTGLVQSLSYQFKVQAKDAAGNLSEYSNAVIVETLGGGSDICEGIEEFDPNKTGDYKIGDKVTYKGKLYVLNSAKRWEYQGDCTSAVLRKHQSRNIESEVDVLAVIPNPIENNVLKVEYSAGLDSKYSIYNIIGQEVKSGVFTNTIDVKNLQEGTYILKVMSNNEIHSVRFVK